MVVDADVALVIVADVPLTWLHAYDAIVPSGSVPLPVKLTVDVGSCIV
jgi:hypothetical protein